MWLRGVQRITAALLGAVLLLETGCGGGAQTLSREDLLSRKPARSYRVVTTGGEDLTFISLELDGDYLTGTIRTTKATTEGEGEAARTATTNVYEERRIPWSDVVTVEADTPRSGGQSWLLAAGAIAAGVAAFVILTDSDEDPPVDGGGKPLP